MGGWVSQVVLIGGQVVGVWNHEKEQTGTQVEVSLFKARSVSKPSMEKALQPLLPFIGEIKSLKIS